MRKKIGVSLFFLWMMCCLVGCQGNTDVNPTEESESAYVDKHGYLENDSVYVVGVEKLPYSHEEIYQQLFDLKNLVEVDIDITEEELEKVAGGFSEEEIKGVDDAPCPICGKKFPV